MLNRDNRYWGKKLADDFKRKTGYERTGIRLPARDHIQFDGELTVTMGQQAIMGNLQENAAAFEAWSLALRVWSDVEEIHLVWERPTNTRQYHYQRFLYRAKRFHSLFPEWFRLDRPELLEDAEALRDGQLYLNVAGDRKQPKISLGKAEAELEKDLLRSRAFRQFFELDDGKLDRQVPVGLFRDSVKNANRIFTGGKSAIDIVGIGGTVLWLFELKAGENNPAGILSELLFYTSVMRDAIEPKPRFTFPKRLKALGTTVGPDDIRRCDRIEAVLLGEKLHPLIGHADVIRCLRDAATRNWKDGIPVNFRGITLRQDYYFTNVEAS